MFKNVRDRYRNRISLYLANYKMETELNIVVQSSIWHLFVMVKD